MLLSAVTDSAAFPLRRAPIEGRLVGGDTTKISKAVISRGSRRRRIGHRHHRAGHAQLRGILHTAVMSKNVKT